MSSTKIFLLAFLAAAIAVICWLFLSTRITTFDRDSVVLGQVSPRPDSALGLVASEPSNEVSENVRFASEDKEYLSAGDVGLPVTSAIPDPYTLDGVHASDVDFDILELDELRAWRRHVRTFQQDEKERFVSDLIPGYFAISHDDYHRAGLLGTNEIYLEIRVSSENNGYVYVPVAKAKYPKIYELRDFASTIVSSRAFWQATKEKRSELEQSVRSNFPDNDIWFRESEDLSLIHI